MFNWFKKIIPAIKAKPESNTPLNGTITLLARSESESFKNQGNVHVGNGRLTEAAECFRQAIARNPYFAEAYANLGLVLQIQGNPGEAVALYRKALECNPDLLMAHLNLGIALMNLGQKDAAEASLRRVIALAPQHAAALQSLGVIAAQRGDYAEAETLLRNVLALQPVNAEAHFSLGGILIGLGRIDDALLSYRHALELKPDYAEAHFGLGDALVRVGHTEGAMASYRQALEIKPDIARVHSNLGNLFKLSNRMTEAEACYRRALELQPDFADAHNNLGNALNYMGRMDEAEASYRRALQINPLDADAYSNLLLSMLYTSNNVSYYVEEALRYGRMVTKVAGTHFSSWQCHAQSTRLRVGLVSGDLCKHPVGFFLEGLLSNIDPARIELFAYPTNDKADELTARIKPGFAAWKSLSGLSDDAAARMIHADGVHILIDLSGHTGHNRLPLFARKPAPVQVTWLGLPATTGMTEMDYVLGDPHAIPGEHENHFSETVWRLPESYLCLSIPVSSVKVAPLPALAAGYVTFGSFNNLTKMTDAVVAAWVRILKSVPNSRLLLKTRQLNDSAACEKTRQRFVSCGIAPDLLLLGGTLASADDHFAMYNKVDIALDTFPYPGVTTSVEALWMGVPVLSLRGDRFLSCTAGSIAYNAGMPDWIAADEDDYVAKAVAFASNLQQLAVLRSELRQRVLASPLFNAPGFAHYFESALYGMWEKWCEQHGAEILKSNRDHET
jgi:predicted O-linked N-acetylglucosamine transferase (SPINDLY family)